MVSSRIERSALIEPPAPAVDDHRRWFKRLLPRSLFGRSLIIIILPLVLAQLIATWVFYDRHWDTVQRRLATSVAGDIALTLDAMRYTDNPDELAALFIHATDSTELYYLFRPGEILPRDVRESGGSHIEEQLAAALVERVRRLVAWLRPGVVLFVGLAGWRAAVDRRAAPGPQPAPFGGGRAYVMPSTSGRNARTTPGELADHFRRALAFADRDP